MKALENKAVINISKIRIREQITTGGFGR